MIGSTIPLGSIPRNNAFQVLSTRAERLGAAGDIEGADQVEGQMKQIGALVGDNLEEVRLSAQDYDKTQADSFQVSQSDFKNAQKVRKRNWLLGGAVAAAGALGLFAALPAVAAAGALAVGTAVGAKVIQHLNPTPEKPQEPVKAEPLVLQAGLGYGDELTQARSQEPRFQPVEALFSDKHASFMATIDQKPTPPTQPAPAENAHSHSCGTEVWDLALAFSLGGVAGSLLT